MSPFLISNFFSPNGEVRRLGDSTSQAMSAANCAVLCGCLKLPCRRDNKYPRYFINIIKYYKISDTPI